MGLVFDIKRYSINDGPGIRVTVFFKGCPLSCVWCHNPEGISAARQKLYTRSRCVGCGECMGACPRGALTMTRGEGAVTDTSRCDLCGECGKVCPGRAVEISGAEYSAGELMGEITREVTVMDRSGGGVTFCGGEPLLFPDQLIDLLIRCGREGIHRAVDTSLFAPPDTVRQVMEHTDLWLVDLKLMDPDRHRRLCGVSNELILDNLRMVTEQGEPTRVRIPLIEGVNTDMDNLEAAARFCASLGWSKPEVDLLPYHDVGRGKHQKLGTVYNPADIPLAVPSDETVRRAAQTFESVGIRVRIGG
jgi:pyruvate formate lyase activating enzyme